MGTLSPVGERGATTQEYEPRGREGVGRLRRRPLPPRSGHTLLPGEAGPSPRAPSAVQWGLPARPCSFLPTSLHEVGGVGVLGGSQGSLPIPAAQLPAVLILAALRVVHLVHTETLLEVLGPDLGVQDLLSHVAGEPASLLVMQTLAEDPAWEGGETKCPKLSQVAWVGPPSGAWEAGGRETAESGRPSQGPLPSHLLMERLRPGVPPETVGGPSWGAQRLCPGRRRSRPHPVPSRVPHALTSGPIPKPSAISGCLTCGQEIPSATPKRERHQGAGGMAAGPGCHPHPLVGQPFPEPQAPESWVVS